MEFPAASGEKWNAMRDDYVDKLINRADNLLYMDFCRWLVVVYWNLYVRLDMVNIQQGIRRKRHKHGVSGPVGVGVKKPPRLHT